MISKPNYFGFDILIYLIVLFILKQINLPTIPWVN